LILSEHFSKEKTVKKKADALSRRSYQPKGNGINEGRAAWVMCLCRSLLAAGF
jgi:hypothetical protein